MLYSNTAHQAEELQLSTFTIKGVKLGESGRGRNALIIPTHRDVVIGVDDRVKVVYSRTNKPKFVTGKQPKELYALIDTHGFYKRGCNGKVSYSVEGAVQVVYTGNGAYGDAGRMGNWFVGLLKIVSSTILHIQYGGGNHDMYIQFLNRNNEWEVIELGNDEEAETHPSIEMDIRCPYKVYA